MYRYGTWGACCMSALMTLPSSSSERLMFCASVSVSPAVPEKQMYSSEGGGARGDHGMISALGQRAGWRARSTSGAGLVDALAAGQVAQRQFPHCAHAIRAICADHIDDEQAVRAR